jgi:hypothetical protein
MLLFWKVSCDLSILETTPSVFTECLTNKDKKIGLLGKRGGNGNISNFAAIKYDRDQTIPLTGLIARANNGQLIVVL